MSAQRTLRTWAFYWLVVAVGGMFLAGVLGQWFGPALAHRWPGLFTHLAHQTLSIRNLTRETEAAQGSILDLSQFDLAAISRAVAVLYGMAAWATTITTAFFLFCGVGAARATATNPEYARLKATPAGFALLVVVMLAIVWILAPYPFQSDQFLRRGGIISGNPFWWSGPFNLLAGCEVAFLCFLGAFFKLLIKRRLLGA